MRFLVDIWRLLDATQRRRVLLAQLISLVMAACTVAGIAAISPFFAVLADPRLIARNRLLAQLHGYLGSQSDREFIVLLGIGFAGIVLAANCLNALGYYAMQRIALKLSDELRGNLFREYLQRGILFHAGAHSATLCGNVTYETERAIGTTLESAFIFVTSGSTAILILASVLWVNALTAVSILGVLGGGYCIVYLLLRARIFRAGRIRSSLAAARARLTLESFGAIKEITIGHRQPFFQRRFDESSAGLSRSIAGLDRLNSAPRYFMESLAVCGLVGLALALSASRERDHWLAQLTFLAFAVYRLMPALHQVFGSVLRIRAAGASFAMIGADLRLARIRRVVSSDQPARGNETPASIECSGVCYRYRTSSRLILDEVSLRVEPGSIVGLVGSNGSGKTTLLDLLAGLLTPDSGQVLVDGVPLDDRSRSSWQSRIAYVPQHAFLLDMTVEQNIALGVEPECIDQARVRSACRLSRFDEVVANLPAGYQEIVGERGSRLSGGQRQRLGVARALYTTAPVLLMDEPSSALDPQTEKELMAAIRSLRGLRTVIIIAHRSGMLQACDKLYELSEGRIIRRPLAEPALGEL